MEKTPHVYLSGEGAKILLHWKTDLKKKKLLTDKAKQAYEQWKEKQQYIPKISPEHHDTIGILAMDSKEAFRGHALLPEWHLKCTEGLAILQSSGLVCMWTTKLERHLQPD